MLGTGSDHVKSLSSRGFATNTAGEHTGLSKTALLASYERPCKSLATGLSLHKAAGIVHHSDHNIKNTEPTYAVNIILIMVDRSDVNN